MKALHTIIAATMLATSACAAVPRPTIIGEADKVARSDASERAKQLAPAAYAHAEKVRAEANAAYDRGDHAGAQILGERAIAAYEHAQVLARVARATEAQTKADADLARSRAELATIEADQARVSAEVADLELRINVVRDAQPIVASRKAEPAREKARMEATRTIALQAQLLCVGARMLQASPSPSPSASPAPTDAAPASSNPAATALTEALDRLAKLRAQLDSGPRAAPIDEATRTRALCLSALTLTRRAAAPVTTAPGLGDALLSELSAAKASPSRDDRGVVLTLRGLFGGAELTTAARDRLAALGRVSAQHPRFPVLVVVHLDRESPAASERAKQQGERVVSALLSAGASSTAPQVAAPRVESVVAGAVAPVVDPKGRDRARNARVEIVFVTPEAS